MQLLLNPLTEGKLREIELLLGNEIALANQRGSMKHNDPIQHCVEASIES